MAIPGFGDRVRIAITPETEAAGFAGRVGEVWDKSAPSAPEVGPVIGDRGDDLALAVVFEVKEDAVWFAPHLVERAERRSRLVPLFWLAVFALPIAAAVPDIARTQVLSLRLVSSATPCFPVQGYMTSGDYPNVRGHSRRVARANLALRRAVVADERRYAPSAKRYVGLDHGPGIYETATDRDLASASTVVVSALIPALKLYPGGTEGQTWIAATIDTRTGRLVSLGALLANPQLALRQLSRDWKAQLQGTSVWPSLAEYPAAYTPTLAHYRYFALTPRGLAFGFPQVPAGSRLAAVIPYRLVRPYLSPLGRRLVAGVRRPRPDHAQRQDVLAWTPDHRATPRRLAGGWPLTCT